MSAVSRPARTRLASIALIAGISLSTLGALHAGDWLRFRGPNGSGVSTDEASTPVEWSDTKNLKWKLALPGPGLSSPIVVGDKVLVTCWTGYGVDRRSPGDEQDLKRHLLCIDRQTGKVVWQRDVDPVLPEDAFRGMFAENGYASHTPVSDGENVYVFFGKTGVLAFDLDGKELWRTSVGTGSDRRGWGSASSPILHEDKVIVVASAESSAMVALDKKTGKEVWRQEAEGYAGIWGTPVLVEVEEGRTDIVLGVPYEIWGINPESGKLRWYVESVENDSMSESVVTDGEVVYTISGRNGGSIAVRAGGKGDRKDEVLWSGNDRARIGTPVCHDGKLYWVSGGILNCLDAKTGKRVYQERLQRTGGASDGDGDGDSESRGAGGRGGRGGRGGFGGSDYSSVVVADGKLYYVTRGGDAYVVRLGEKFEQLAHNRFADEGEYSATPAVSDGELFIRSTTHLYCVAETK